ncbi:MAG: glycosyltransferase family 2 protein [Candidatus Cryptobacteroides sp.]
MKNDIIPTVSVIVPIFNVEPFLAQCIDSLLNQTFTDFEVLLVDDGSTDNSLKICRKFESADCRIKCFHKENGGLSSARNYGLDRAIGRYISFIDSDDYLWEKDALSKSVSYLEENRLDILRFDYVSVDSNGSFLKEGPAHNKKHLRGIVFDSEVMVEEAVKGEWFSCLFMIRKDVIKDLRFDENRSYQEDIDYFARLFALGNFRCGYIPEGFYAYRQRKSSLTNVFKVSNFHGSFTLCDVFAGLVDTMHECKLKEIYRYYSVMMYYWTLNAVTDDQYYPNRAAILYGSEADKYHRSTLKRLKYVNNIKKYKIFIVLNPSVSLRLLRVKTKAVLCLNKIRRLWNTLL